MRLQDYLILLLSFSVGLGLFNSILTLIYQIISPYGMYLAVCIIIYRMS